MWVGATFMGLDREHTDSGIYETWIFLPEV